MIKSLQRFSREDIPVLALAVHHGHDLPPELEVNCGISPHQRLMEEDPFTGEIAALYPNHIVVHTSRFAVDLNRSEDKCVYQKPEDCWGLSARKVPLPDNVINALRVAYRDWYSLLAHHIDRLLIRHERLIIWDLHSYNHRRYGADLPAEPQDKNPDINLGSSNMPPQDLLLLKSLQQLLSETMITNNGRQTDCRIDVKFPGGHLVRWLHHNYPRRVIAPAVEFKKFFMDEWTGILDEQCFKRLCNAFVEQTGLWVNELMVAKPEGTNA